MVELESEGELSRDQVAAFLHQFADELEEGSRGRRSTADRGGSSSESRSGEADAIGNRRDESPIEGVEGDGDDEPSDRHRTDSGEVVEHTGNHERITLIVGGESATVSVPERFDFDVEVESRSPMLSSGVNQGIEFDLSWKIENPDRIDEEEWLEVE